LDAWRSEVGAVDLTNTGIAATGTQVGVDPLPYRVDYDLDARDGFVTRRLVVSAAGAGWSRQVDLQHDGDGSWTVAAVATGRVDLPAPGGNAATVQGALDCDLGLSPLTNLMPIRRSGLAERPGGADFLMAWVSVPDLTVLASAQRYEHVGQSQLGPVVRYVDRGLFPGFTADLQLDSSCVVLVYPNLAQRVESPQPA